MLFDPEDKAEVEVHGELYVVVRERDIHAVAADRLGDARPGYTSDSRPPPHCRVGDSTKVAGVKTPTATHLPSYGDDLRVVVPAPGIGAGNWAGAASAVLVDGVFWLTWRVRRPLTEGRGVTVVVARSEDGETFESVAEVDRDAFGAESFERPVLMPVPDLGWRLYLSCATPGSKHWWVDSLTAASVEELPAGRQQVVLPGDEHLAVKDPVITRDADGWHLWLCCHPLDEPGTRTG